MSATRTTPDPAVAARQAAHPHPWAGDVDAVLTALHVDPTRGLSTPEARARLATVGSNDIRLERDRPVWRSVLDQLREPMVLVLLAALILTVLTGDLADAAVIALVVAVNTTVGVVQERRAARAVTALRSLTAPAARVRRDGRTVTVAAGDVVPGDILLVREGDLVAADARLLDAHGLEIDEASLTGESVPAGKSAQEAVAVDVPVADRTTMLHAGTTVVRGHGEAVVVGTGARSQVGALAGLLASNAPPATPLQRRLRTLGGQLSIVTIAACVVVAVLGLLRGQSWEVVLLTAISLAVAAIPESLPAVVTLALAGGAHRMARRGAIVRSLPAVETLGSVTVLATDKTGTLTQGAMVCVAAWTPSDGDSPLGGEAAAPPGVRTLLEAGVLCNDAPDDTGDEGGAAPSAGTEGSILHAATLAGIDVAACRRARPRLKEVPFDAARRSMRTWHQDGPSTLEIVKGAPEVVLGELEGRPTVADAAEVAERWAGEGRRVLAVSARRDDQPPVLLGLLALADPLRPEARDAVLACRRAGMTPVLVTGDHAGTARAIALATGIVDPSDGPDVVDRRVHARRRAGRGRPAGARPGGARGEARPRHGLAA